MPDTRAAKIERYTMLSATENLIINLGQLFDIFGTLDETDIVLEAVTELRDDLWPDEQYDASDNHANPEFALADARGDILVAQWLIRLAHTDVRDGLLQRADEFQGIALRELSLAESGGALGGGRDA
jgi:hypothetical protein